MLDVSKISKTQTTKSSKSKTNTSGANFADYLNQAGQVGSSNISGMGGVSISNALFATQMITDEEEQKRKKQAVERGFNLLEKLEDIRDSILLNDFSKDKLIEISRYVKNVNQNTNDDKLNEIVAEIELRVEVELAKLEMHFSF